MPGSCSHQFVWPQRASDGRYYQTCRLCDAEYEYDWENMVRLPRGDTAVSASPEMGRSTLGRSGTGHKSIGQSSFGEGKGGSTATALATEVATRSVKVRDVPRLNLLLEAEPAHRVFVGNLAHLIASRSPRLTTAPSIPGSFLSDVFVPSGLPWQWFAESLLGHLILVAAVLIVVQKWPVSGPIEQARAFHRSYVSYYTPPKSFPALGSHSPRVWPQVHRTPEPARQGAIRVAAEHAHKGGQSPSTLRPPELTAGGAGKLGAKLGLALPHLAPPIMPLSATGRSGLTVPAGATWIVAPPADSRQASARRSGSLPTAAVAPSPEVAGVSSGRVAGTAGSEGTVIAPPPSVPGSMRRAGDINIGQSAVVLPAPQLPTEAQGVLSGMAKAGLGTLSGAIVPPPPSMQGGGGILEGRSSDGRGDGRGNSFTASGVQVVPPAPSVPGAGEGSASGRRISLSAGLQGVAPAPSVQGSGNGVKGRANSFSGVGTEVVPPAPSTQGTGRGGGLGDSLSAGLAGVPPPPSVQGEGGGGSGRGNSLSGTGAGLPPASSAQGEGAGAGNSAGGGSSAKGNASGNAMASADATSDPNEPPTLEIPLRLIGPVLALPGSSYFSNYEVFIAERELGRNKSQFIKLVYVSLPYQRRLSEYAANNSEVRRLRVTRDQSCDESLLQMTWPETDPRPDAQHATDSPALTAKDRNGMLPCYRTTADDYRRAIARKR